jgi:dUTP pyrophosphatase
MKMKVKLDPVAYMPIRAHKADAGYDLRSPITARLYAGEAIVIDTGVHVQIPEGYCGMLKSKSGLNVKHDIVGEGVIDSGYTGSIRVKIYKHGKESYMIEKGDKITQLVLLPIITPGLEIVDDLEETERGTGGFGSTGK